MLFFLVLLIIQSSSIERLILDDPFIVYSNDTVSSLYDGIKAKVSYSNAPCGISVLFNGELILNVVNDQRTVRDIGMKEESNDIQIIPKPIFAALLEMISDISNIQEITWFMHACTLHAMHSVSAKDSRVLCECARGLHCDDNGVLIGIDLSHLNLTGTIYLESLPQTVRSLDLSYNDLNNLNLDGLRGKSVEKLNVENNARCHINTECFCIRFGFTTCIRELQISSNQIFPWVPMMNKYDRINNWLHQTYALEKVIVDDVVIYREIHKFPLHRQMLRVIEGVTNKEVIPWYLLFTKGWAIATGQWKDYRVRYKKRHAGYSHARYWFNLSGLGLEGHIELQYLPKPVVELDLSDNNLNNISFVGDGRVHLRVLDLRNNDHLRINLSSATGCLRHLIRLSISSNQLDFDGMWNAIRITKNEFVWLWMRSTHLRELVMDNTVFVNNKNNMII